MLYAYVPSEKEKRHMIEIVICAAIKLPDGYVIRSHRHHNALRVLREIPSYEDVKWHHCDQGFVTSLNRFVGRKEGYEIQKAAGIKSAREGTEYAGEAYLHGELYSEDLY